MSGKQRPPRPARQHAAQRAAERGPASAPAWNWLDQVLSHGNQAAGQQLVGRTLTEDGGPGLAPTLDEEGPAADVATGDYDEIWAEMAEMIDHSTLSFRQLLALIAAQPELSADERIRMQEQARQRYQGE